MIIAFSISFQIKSSQAKVLQDFKALSPGFKGCLLLMKLNEIMYWELSTLPAKLELMCLQAYSLILGL